MADDTNPPEAARLLVRMPLELKDRLQARALANGRSMNSEIIDLLERGLNDSSLNALMRLRRQAAEVVAEIAHASRGIEVAKRRKEMLLNELRERIGRDLGDNDPLEYVEQLVRADQQERQAKIGEPSGHDPDWLFSKGIAEAEAEEDNG